MARVARPDCFRGKRESVVLLSTDSSLLGGSGPEPERDRHLKYISMVGQGHRFGFKTARGLI